MSPLATFRRAPWLSGALALLLVGGMIAPLGLRLGSRYWAYYVGLAVFLLLSLRWIERGFKHAPPAPPPLPPRAGHAARCARCGAHAPTARKSTSPRSRRPAAKGG